MPLESIPERAISEDSEYTTTRRSKNEEIVVQMLKLVGLNIAKVMTDVAENGDDKQLLYEMRGCYRICPQTSTTSWFSSTANY